MKKTQFNKFLCIFLVAAVISICAIYGIYYAVSQAHIQSNGIEGGISWSRPRVDDFRLPSSIKPLHQYVKLQPFLHGNFSVNGYTEVELEVLETTNKIVLHMVDIITKNETIKLMSQGDNGTTEIFFSSHTYDPSLDFYTGETTISLNPGIYVFSLEFTGYLNENLVGFYRTSYTDENLNEVPIGVSQFAAIDARRSFPCFDEPAMKSTFKIDMIREENVMTLGNMPLESSNPISDQPGWYLDSFQVSLPMSTYLVAYVLSDFVAQSSNENDHVLFRVWAQKSAIDEASYALSMGPKVLTYYEQYYEIPFPLPKQDMVAIPDFFYGAMENWGLITYRGSRLLYNPEVSSAESKQRVCVIVAHELAHQWFGNLVTTMWWNDIWLNEGFATFIQQYGCDQVEPTFAMLDQFFISDFHVSLAVDSLETSHPLDYPINTADDIGGIYDTISYSKGGSVLHMIMNFITESSFRHGLVNYLKEFSYSNAVRDDLWRHLTNQSHIDGTLSLNFTIKELMEPWATQTGYPVLTVNRLSNETVLLTQERFLLIQNSTAPNHTWWIPLTYSSDDSPDFNDTRAQIWMSPEEKTKILDGLSSTSKWVIFNVQQNAYYRVNYDTDNWLAIIDQLVTDHEKIHRLNRAQLLNDAYNLARAGRVIYDIPLGINSYLNNETEYVPVYAALEELEYIQYMFQQQDGYPSLKDYLLELLVPLYNRVGFEDNLQDPHVIQLQRTLLSSWVCDLGYLPCVENSTDLYTEWMENPSNHTIVSPNLKETVYCTAVAAGGNSEWQFSLYQYESTTFATEQELYLKAMGCTTDTNLLLNYLSLTFSVGVIKKQDASVVVSATSGNPVGEDLTWNYIYENATNIASYMGSFRYVATYVDLASKNFNTQEELQKLEDFKSRYSEDLSTSVQTVNSAIERTKNNIDWMTNYYDTILQWLQTHETPYGLRL